MPDSFAFTYKTCILKMVNVVILSSSNIVDLFLWFFSARVYGWFLFFSFFGRALTFVSNSFEQTIQPMKLEKGDEVLIAQVNKQLHCYINNMENAKSVFFFFFPLLFFPLFVFLFFLRCFLSYLFSLISLLSFSFIKI